MGQYLSASAQNQQARTITLNARLLSDQLRR
jgi:hypothetical protein